MGFSPVYNDNCEQILQQKDLKNLHITRGGGGGGGEESRKSEPRKICLLNSRVPLKTNQVFFFNQDNKEDAGGHLRVGHTLSITGWKVQRRYFFNVYIGVGHEHMWTHLPVKSRRGRQIPLRLESWIIESCLLWVLGTKFGYSANNLFSYPVSHLCRLGLKSLTYFKYFPCRRVLCGTRPARTGSPGKCWSCRQMWWQAGQQREAHCGGPR